jgi:hypothetical protein
MFAYLGIDNAQKPCVAFLRLLDGPSDRHARDGRREKDGRSEGRRPVPDAVVIEARRLARRNPKTAKRRSLRTIAAELEFLGHLGPSGQPYHVGSVRHMLGG